MHLKTELKNGKLLWFASNNGKDKVNMSEFLNKSSPITTSNAKVYLMIFKKTNKNIKMHFGKAQGYARKYAFDLLEDKKV